MFDALIELNNIRPPLRKKLFPVRQVTPKKVSREVGNLFFFFFFIISFLYKLECTGGK